MTSADKGMNPTDADPN